MASGIVEVCAKSGYDVVFRARSDDKVAAVQAKITKSLDKAVQRGKLSDDDRGALARITGTTELDDLAGCDLVIEAASKTSRSSRRCSPPWTRSASPARCWRRPRPACR